MEVELLLLQLPRQLRRQKKQRRILLFQFQMKGNQYRRYVRDLYDRDGILEKKRWIQ